MLLMMAPVCMLGQELDGNEEYAQGALGYIEYNPFNPVITAQDANPSDRPTLTGMDGQDAMKCFLLNTAAHRMEPQGFGGSSPKEWSSFGFHAHSTMETQVVFPPSAAQYRPLARLPKNDGCAYQANFRAGTGSGCTVTGVSAEPVAAGGFRFPDPRSNASHCQLFASCIPEAVWESDPRHAQDIGAQGQWCSEIGGCWRPATGIKTHGCLCYSDRPLKDFYGPAVQAEPLPETVNGTMALACMQNWIRIMGGTRCGYFGFGNLDRQHPTGHIIRDKGEGKQENPAQVTSQQARMHGDALEQDSDSFVFRRHPSCYGWNNDSNGAIAGTIGQAPTVVSGPCVYEGQLQLGARAVSDSGEPQIKTFKTALNHSNIFTLRITTRDRGSVYELLQADGSSLIERVEHSHRMCHNFALGRNMGLGRLPLPNASILEPTCALQTPIEACYGSEPMSWGSQDRVWRRNSGSHMPLPSHVNPLESPLPTLATDPGVKCQIPFCTPN